MIQSILNTLFGCSHRRTTFPMTPVRRNVAFPGPGSARKGPYVVCLDCGKAFAYDWDTMRVGEPVAPQAPAAAAQPQFR